MPRNIPRSLVIADAREACLKEAGDIMMPIATGEITADHIQAAATAKLVYDRARERGVGSDFEL